MPSFSSRWAPILVMASTSFVLSFTACANDPAAATISPNPDLETLCDHLTVTAEGDEVTISNLTVYRSPLDFHGTRLAGCITNRTDEIIDHFTLIYHLIVPRSGGLGNRPVLVAPVAPGETRPFVTLQAYVSLGFKDEVTAIRPVAIETTPNPLNPNDRNRMMITASEEFPRTALPRPSLEMVCEPASRQEGEGHIYIHDVDLVVPEFALNGSEFLVGCVTNHGETELGGEATLGVPVRLYRRPPATSSDERGRMELLRLAEPIAPGEASVFISESRGSAFEGYDEFDIVPIKRGAHVGPPEANTDGPLITITRQ